MKVPLMKHGGNPHPLMSEVYRELERHAVKKGFFEIRDEERVKLAAQQLKHDKENDFSPSDNLEFDIARLADGLRSRGFERHADALENNYVMYKSAESSLYDLPSDDVVDFAHRDGSVKLFDAESEYGVVEDKKDQAKKIKKIVEKGPEKRAMRRFAQDEDQGFRDPNEVAKDVAATTTASFARERQRKPINAGSLSLNSQSLREQAGMSLYSALTGVKQDRLQAYFNARAAAKNNGFIDGSGNVTSARVAQVIKADPTNGNFNRVSSFASVLGIGVGQYYKPEAGLLSTTTKIDSNNIDTVASSLANRYNQIMSAAIGPGGSRFNSVRNQLSGAVSGLYEQIDAIPATVAGDTADVVLQDLMNIQSGLNNAWKSFSRSQNGQIIKVARLPDYAALSNYVSRMSAIIKDGVAKVSKAARVKLYKADLGPLKEAQRYWQQLVERSGLSKEDRQAYQKVLNRINTVGRIIQKNSGKPWPFVSKALSDVGYKFDSPQDLDNTLKQLAKYRVDEE